jgi:hypothetical protein
MLHFIPLCQGKIMRRWKKKYFVLDNFLLRYYHDAKEITAGTAPNGIVTLSNCSILKGGISETFGSMKINLSDGAAGRLYCFSGPDAEEIIEWYKEIEAVIKLRNNGGSNVDRPLSNSVDDSGSTSTDGLRRRFTASDDNKGGSEGEDEDDTPADRGGRSKTNSIDGVSAMSLSGGGGSDRVMRLLRSRGISHGYDGRKKNKRLQQSLKMPLANSVKQLVSLYREADAWQLLGVEEDVRLSLLKPKVAKERGLAFPTPIDMSIKASPPKKGKRAPSQPPTYKQSEKFEAMGSGKSHGMLPVISGTCIIKAPPSAVSRLIMDPRERGSWDPHFFDAEEVDSCFPRTQIVRLKGRLAWRRPPGSSIDEVCQRVAEKKNGKMSLCGCRDMILGNSSLLSVMSNAALAAGISSTAAYAASMAGSDPTLAAIAGAAVAGAACWHSDGKPTSSGVGVLGVDNGSSVGGSNGRWSMGPVTWDVESRAKDRTILTVQHLCTMGRDSDVIVERSVLSNNSKYNGTTADNSGSGKNKKKKKKKSNKPEDLKKYVVGTFGLSGWIIEPLVVRERVVSQVTYVASIDGGGWLPSPLNASLVMERLSCLTCLKALAAQTLDTDSWGAEMDLARRPGDLWEPGAEKYWTDGRSYKDESGFDSENSDNGGGGGEDDEKLIKTGTTMKEATVDSQEPMTFVKYRCPDLVVRSSGYLDSYSDGYKQKEESGDPLYEVVTIDVFKTEEKHKRMSDYFEMPAEIKEKDGETSGVPHTFVYNAMMPAYEAAMWGKTEGKSHNAVAW